MKRLLWRIAIIRALHVPWRQALQFLWTGKCDYFVKDWEKW